MNEILDNLKEARQSALLGNYEASQVFYEGVLHDLQKLIHAYTSVEEEKLKLPKQALYKYNQLVKIESQQVKELANALDVFKTASMAAAAKQAPSGVGGSPISNNGFGNVRQPPAAAIGIGGYGNINNYADVDPFINNNYPYNNNTCGLHRHHPLSPKTTTSKITMVHTTITTTRTTRANKLMPV